MCNTCPDLCVEKREEIPFLVSSWKTVCSLLSAFHETLVECQVSLKSRNITPLAPKIQTFLLMQHVKVVKLKKNEIRIKQWTSTLAFLYRTRAFWRWDSTLQMGQKCAQFSQKMSPPPQTMVLDCCAVHLCFSLWVSAHQQTLPFFFLPFYF